MKYAFLVIYIFLIGIKKRTVANNSQQLFFYETFKNPKDYLFSSIVAILTRFHSGSENISPIPLPSAEIRLGSIL